MNRHDQNIGGPLLRPLDLGDLNLPNRVVMAPLTRCRATGPDLAPSDLHAAYYGQRVSAGLIVSEGVWVSERAIGSFPGVPGLWSARQVAAWARVTGLVHALGGRIVAQLWHAGPEETVTTAVPDFAEAARNARRAGFDGVEIAANGTYLIASILNPRLGRRTDAYGADRTRPVLEIVDAVTAVWEGRRAGVRLSPYWTVADEPRAARRREEYPWTADEETLAGYDALVAELSERPLAYLHLRGPAPQGPGPDGTAPDTDAVARYRKAFAGPLVANHGYDRTTANALVEAGLADAVSFGRAFIANPDLPGRLAFGHAPAPSDPSTHYTGGARGYVDHPIWAGPVEP